MQSLQRGSGFKQFSLCAQHIYLKWKLYQLNSIKLSQPPISILPPIYKKQKDTTFQGETMYLDHVSCCSFNEELGHAKVSLISIIQNPQLPKLKLNTQIGPTDQIALHLQTFFFFFFVQVFLRLGPPSAAAGGTF